MKTIEVNIYIYMYIYIYGNGNGIWSRRPHVCCRLRENYKHKNAVWRTTVAVGRWQFLLCGGRSQRRGSRARSSQGTRRAAQNAQWRRREPAAGQAASGSRGRRCGRRVRPSHAGLSRDSLISLDAQFLHRVCGLRSRLPRGACLCSGPACAAIHTVAAASAARRVASRRSRAALAAAREEHFASPVDAYVGASRRVAQYY